MTKVIGRRADVSAHCLSYQPFRIVTQFGREQRFDRWTHAIDDGAEIPRLVLAGALQFFDGREDGTALCVTEDDHEARA